MPNSFITAFNASFLLASVLFAFSATLIYACNLEYEPEQSPSLKFFNRLKIYYKIREHQFYDKSNILEDYKKHKKTSKTDERKNVLNIDKSKIKMIKKSLISGIETGLRSIMSKPIV